MLKNYKLGPRQAIYTMSVLILVLSIGGAFFDASNQPRPLQLTFYLGWVVLNVFAIALVYWWFSKTWRIKDWENWAKKNGGKYEHTNVKYLTGYGNVLDKLSGINPMTGQPFYLYRTFYVSFRSWAQNGRGVVSSVLLSDSDDGTYPQEFKAVKSYLTKCADR